MASFAVEPADPRMAGYAEGASDMMLRLRESTEEAARQLRVAQGIEHACAACGCSESRACDGGCVWATDALCSRCV